MILFIFFGNVLILDTDCGAATPVEQKLNDMKEKYGIRLAVEKFNW